mmetsp:Transcript_33728/g.104133  ORF Transcript_33728/g.104133 Transcript_33728/m.104133 type:complete len:218 (-) Transcript_33728:1021-1674(-)
MRSRKRAVSLRRRCCRSFSAVVSPRSWSRMSCSSCRSCAWRSSFELVLDDSVAPTSAKSTSPTPASTSASTAAAEVCVRGSLAYRATLHTLGALSGLRSSSSMSTLRLTLTCIIAWCRERSSTTVSKGESYGRSRHVLRALARSFRSSLLRKACATPPTRGFSALFCTRRESVSPWAVPMRRMPRCDMDSAVSASCSVAISSMMTKSGEWFCTACVM